MEEINEKYEKLIQATPNDPQIYYDWGCGFRDRP